MGWIQELMDLFAKFRFYTIVYEYEQALYFRNGKALDLSAKLTKEEKTMIFAQENALTKSLGGRLSCLFARYPLPKNWKRNILGQPMHPARYRKVMSQGFYLHLPLIDDIVKQSKQEKVLNLGNISVPTIDPEPKSRPIIISCNLRYEVINLYRAYTIVDDYERSLKDHTLSILATYSRGKTIEEWKNPKVIDALETRTLNELRKIVTDRWGLKIHKIYITDHVPATIQRISHEGATVLTQDLTPKEDVTGG